MKRTLRRFACLTALFSVIVFSANAQQQVEQIPALFSTGLPEAASPEDGLPAGAIAYIRLNNALTLLDNLDSFASTIVPEKALPPEFAEIFAKPKPIVTFLGMQLAGQAIPLEEFPARLGIALDRPIALAIYPTPNGFALSVPIADSTVAVNLIQGMLQPRRITKFEAGPKSYYHIIPASNFGKELYMAASEKTAVFCGSQETLTALLNAPQESRLAVDPIMKNGVAAYEKGDVTLILSPNALKPQLPMLSQQLGGLPQMLFPMLHSMIDEISAADRLMLETRLRVQFGIQSLDLLVNYLEAYGAGAYRASLEALLQLLTNLEGAAVGLDLDTTYQRTSFSLYSKDIAPEKMAQPLPMAEIKKMLTLLPGAKNSFVAIGKMPQGEPSVFVSNLFASIEKELDAKQLSKEGFIAFKTQMLAQKPVAPLETRADWTIRAFVPLSLKTDFSQFASLWRLFKYETDRLATEAVIEQAMLLPAQASGVVEAYFQDKADAAIRENQQAQALYEAAPLMAPWFTTSSAFAQEDAQDGMKKLTFENIHTTRRGYFGYQQHELINRQIMFLKQVGDAQLLYTGSITPTAASAFMSATYPAMPPAVSKLLDFAPETASMFSVTRSFAFLPEAFDILSGIEEVTRRELDAFLAKAQTLVDQSSSEEEFTQQLIASGLDLPIVMEGLYVDGEGKVFCTLPGKLRYPRPAAIPAVKALFADALAAAADMGGNLTYMTVQPGKVEFANVQSTDALALLVKSVTNHFYETYVLPKDGASVLQNTFMHPEDAQDVDGTLLLLNPLWEKLEENGSGVGLSGRPSGVSGTAAILRSYATALGSYQVDMNYFPKYPSVTPIEAVQFTSNYTSPYYEGSYVDEWGNPIRYLSDADGQNYMLVSYGEDGLPGVNDERISDDLVFMNGMLIVSPENDVNFNVNDALFLAIQGNSSDFVIVALGAGADPNAANSAGATAIAFAETLGFSDIVTILEEVVGEESSEPAEETTDETAADETAEKSEEPVEEGLRGSETAKSISGFAILLGSYQIDKESFPKYPELTPIEQVELPKEYKEYFSAKYVDVWGKPIYYLSDATGENYLMISYGQDGFPGQSESEADNDLIWLNWAFIAPEELAEDAQDVSALNTALFLAIRGKSADVVTALLDAGAEPTATDEDGKSALALAKALRLSDIVDALEKAGATE